jgi:hypothetical protein
MIELTDKENIVLSRLNDLARTGELSNECLVQIIELTGGYLNLQTISEYAKENNLSYNGVKKCRNIVNLFGCKFVVDND